VRAGGDEALAPLAVFAARGCADDANRGSVACFEGKAGQTGNDGLQLIVVRGAIGGEGDDAAQGCIGLGQVADFCATPGGQRLEAERFPGGVGMALNQHTILWQGGVVIRIQAPPTATAEGFVDIKTELGVGAAGVWLDRAGQAGFGEGIDLALADAGELESVIAGLPSLGAVEHEDTDAADIAKVIEAAGKNIGVNGFAIKPGVEAGSGKRENFTVDEGEG